MTPYYYGQFALSLEKESPYIFYEIDRRNAHPVNAGNSNAPVLPPQFPYLRGLRLLVFIFFMMGAAKRSAFSLRSFARSHVAFNCVLVEVMERKANVAFETNSLKLDLSMVAWLSSMNGLQELCVYVFQIRVITVTPDDIS